MTTKRVLIDATLSGMAGVVEFDEVADGTTTTYEVVGSCSRCGACCVRGTGPTYWRNEDGTCQKLSHETIDGDVLAVCLVQWEKPFGCRVWPIESDADLPDTCGYAIEQKTG